MPDQEEKVRRITGTYSMKPYRCNACKHEAMHGTNHWGEIYPQCRNCGTINGMTCLEPLPEGFQMPEKWKLGRLGDLISIEGGRHA